MIRKLIIKFVRRLEKTNLFLRHETRAVERLVRDKRIWEYREL